MYLFSPQWPYKAQQIATENEKRKTCKKIRFPRMWLKSLRSKQCPPLSRNVLPKRSLVHTGISDENSAPLSLPLMHTPLSSSTPPLSLSLSAARTFEWGFPAFSPLPLHHLSLPLSLSDTKHGVTHAHIDPPIPPLSILR